MRIFAGLLIFVFVVSSAAGSGTYRDPNGYFTFTPPKGWVLQELREDSESKIQCQSPDGEAVIGIIVRLREGTFQDVVEGQKNYLQTQRKFFPENKYIMSDTFLCGFKTSEIEMEAPGGMKQVLYVFLAGDMRFNITYAALSAETFEKHEKEASESFSSLRTLK